MMLRNARTLIREHWLAITLHVLLFGFLAAALLWQLSGLTHGYAQPELGAHAASSTLKQIYDAPLNAPFTLINNGLSHLSQHSLWLARAVAASISLVTLGVFYVLVRNWHGTRVAWLGTLMFGTSAMFLHTGRLGTPAVLAYLLFLLAAAGFWMKQRRGGWAVFLVCLIAAMLLYVPGMVLPLVVGAIWQWKMIDRSFKEHLGIVSIGALLFTAAIAPLAWALYRTPEMAKQWAGLPPNGWPDAVQVVKNIILVPVHLFIKNGADPVTWLGTAPVLDIFTAVMLLVGVLTYCRSIRLRRTQLLIAFFVLIAGLIGLGGGITLVILLPFLYLLVAGGLYAILNEWLTVFPRNPLARGVGIGLITAAVLIACGLHLKHYFIGWPQAQTTHDSFTIQRP